MRNKKHDNPNPTIYHKIPRLRKFVPPGVEVFRWKKNGPSPYTWRNKKKSEKKWGVELGLSFNTETFNPIRGTIKNVYYMYLDPIHAAKRAAHSTSLAPLN